MVYAQKQSLAFSYPVNVPILGQLQFIFSDYVLCE